MNKLYNNDNIYMNDTRKKFKWKLQHNLKIGKQTF